MGKLALAATIAVIGAGLCSAPVWDEIAFDGIVHLPPSTKEQYGRAPIKEQKPIVIYGKGKLGLDRYYHYIKKVC